MDDGETVNEDEAEQNEQDNAPDAEDEGYYDTDDGDQ